MKEEMINKIKKCLVAGYDVDVINQEEMGVLWNYITNLQEYYNDNVNKYEELLVKYSDLQEENERLRKQNTEYQDEIFARDNNWYDMQD